MNIKYVSPSSNRADGITTLDYATKCKMYISKEDYPNYVKYNPQHKDKFIIVPDGVQNHGKSKCMNWMLENLWDDDTDAIVMMDDDWTCLRAHELNGKDRTIPEDEFYEIVERYTQLAKEFGVGLWSFNLNSDPMTYDCFKPFRLHAYLDGQFTCWCERNEIRYDEELTIKEDVDFCLQNMKKYHKALRVDKYYPVCKGFTNDGGCNDFRSKDEEQRQFKMMQKKWGSSVIRPNKPTAVKNSRIRGYGGAIRLHVPLSGC